MNRSDDTDQADNACLAALLRDHAEPLCDDWRERLRAVGGNHQRGLIPETEQRAEMLALLAGMAQALLAGDNSFDHDSAHPLAVSLRNASQTRAARGFTPEDSLHFVQTCRDALVDAVHGHAPLQGMQPWAARRIERLVDRAVRLLASAFVAAREDVIRAQSTSLREVSTPVITLWDSILLLPLIGVVDSVRAQQISERLLEAIADTESEVTLIDVTGVPVMDTSVARHILKTVAAAEMLGTRVILTGISPSTAQTMVKLGIDMSGVPTRGSLKAGMSLALAMTGRHIASTAGG